MSIKNRLYMDYTVIGQKTVGSYSYKNLRFDQYKNMSLFANNNARYFIIERKFLNIRQTIYLKNFIDDDNDYYDDDSYTEGEEIMINNEIENLILSGTGIKGLKNLAITKLIKEVMEKTKSHFGFELIYTTQLDSVNELISKMDKNFNKHSTDINRWNYKAINSTFILKLRKDTYLLVSGDCDFKSENIREKIYLYFFGKKAYQELNKFKNRLKNTENNKNTTAVYNISVSEYNKSDWICDGKYIKSRSFDTLYFDDEIDKKIKKFLDNWLLNEDVYKRRGLTFKTGILIHGNPGTGKSSIASAIADYLDCNIIDIDMSSFSTINLSSLVNTINRDNEKYVILLDEIDAIFKDRDDDITENQNNKVIKLLSFLDSVNSPSDVVFVATTNYYDKLDKALIRKGRFDKQIELNGISKETARRMCEGFGLNESSIKYLLNSKSDDELINPSSLQFEILEQVKKEINSN